MFLIIQMDADPYKLMEDNFLAVCCRFSSTTFFIFLLVVKVVAFAEEIETFPTLAGTAADFIVDRFALSCGLIAAVLGSLGLAGILLLLRIAAVHYEVKKRAKQEAFRLAHSLNEAELQALQARPSLVIIS